MVKKLEEISKKTLGSYIKRAASDNTDRAGWQGIDSTYHAINTGERRDPYHWDEFADKHTKRKFNNREKGIKRAVGKLTKEEMENQEETTLEALLFEAYDDIIRGSIEDRPADVQDALKAVLDQKIGERLDALRVDIPMNTFDVPSANTDGDEGEEEWEDDDEWEIEDEDDGEIEVAEEELEVEEDEEEDRLDEISKTTLASYIQKSHRDRSASWGSKAEYEKRAIADNNKTYDTLSKATNIGSTLRGDDYNAVHQVRQNLYDHGKKLERAHDRKNEYRRQGVRHALDRLQGKFGGKVRRWEEPEKTPTGRDSKNKTIKKSETVYKNYKGE